MSKISTIAAFDFDGTITYRDTLLPFLFFAQGLPIACAKIGCELPALSQFCLGRLSRHQLKEKIIRRFFGKMTKKELEEIGERFANESLEEKIKPEAFAQFNWHQSEGHRCVLVSANLDVFLKPWAKSVGFDDVICTELETKPDGRIAGTFNGGNCWGSEKVKRLQKLLGPRENYLLYAYGDSRGDHEMMMLADYPFYCTF